MRSHILKWHFRCCRRRRWYSELASHIHLRVEVGQLTHTNYLQKELHWIIETKLILTWLGGPPSAPTGRKYSSWHTHSVSTSFYIASFPVLNLNKYLPMKTHNSYAKSICMIIRKQNFPFTMMSEVFRHNILLHPASKSHSLPMANAAFIPRPDKQKQCHFAL